jgi:splicing factor U2AF subunit
MTPQQYKALAASGQLPASSSLGISMDGGYMSMQTRRVYIGGIPFGMAGDQMVDFFNQKMHEHGLAVGPGNPVLACQINIDKNFAFLEFRTAEETTACLAFDGIMLMGQPLKLRRPKDYVPMVGTEIQAMSNFNGGLAPCNSSSLDKIFVGGLPTYLNDEQVKELLQTFGALRSFSFMKDSATEQSKGYAFCEYQDSSITDEACGALNGMQLGDKRLVVQRASIGAKAHVTSTFNQMPVTPQIPGLKVAGNLTIGKPTEVLCLMNMVAPEDLVDDEDYEDIVEDIKEECSKYGTVKSLEIPRPVKSETGEAPEVGSGVGKVFVEFDNVMDCQKAMSTLTGRKFQNRTVVTSFIDIDKYHQRDF